LQCFNNIQIVEIFREKSVGGGNELENRPATQTLARFVAVNSMGKMPPLFACDRRDAWVELSFRPEY